MFTCCETVQREGRGAGRRRGSIDAAGGLAWRGGTGERDLYLIADERHARYRGTLEAHAEGCGDDRGVGVVIVGIPVAVDVVVARVAHIVGVEVVLVRVEQLGAVVGVVHHAVAVGVRVDHGRVVR